MLVHSHCGDMPFCAQNWLKRAKVPNCIMGDALRDREPDELGNGEPNELGNEGPDETDETDDGVPEDTENSESDELLAEGDDGVGTEGWSSTGSFSLRV